jgi:large subunit ribosomal protein L22
MTGPKTNERAARDISSFDGTRAVLRHARVAPNKVREVLNLVRGLPVHEAEDILRFSERDAAFTVGKLLQSAVANAQHNDELEPEELYVSACYADEGPTIKRWRPRARGRATRIRKRTTHITVIVARLPEQDLERLQAHRRAEQLAQRARRVSSSRGDDTRNRAQRRRNEPIEPDHDHDHDHDDSPSDVAGDSPTSEQQVTESADGTSAEVTPEVVEVEEEHTEGAESASDDSPSEGEEA